jgi:hypothetical protein
MYEFTVTYPEAIVRASARVVYVSEHWSIRRALDWKLVVARMMTIGSLIVVHLSRGAFWLDGAVARSGDLTRPHQLIAGRHG